MDLPLLLVVGLRQFSPSGTNTGWVLNRDGCVFELNWISSCHVSLLEIISDRELVLIPGPISVHVLQPFGCYRNGPGQSQSLDIRARSGLWKIEPRFLDVSVSRCCN